RLVDPHVDPERWIISQKLRLRDRRVAQTVAGIGSIGNELAEEYLLVGIDRMHHQVENAPDLGLKRKRVFAHPLEIPVLIVSASCSAGPRSICELPHPVQ